MSITATGTATGFSAPSTSRVCYANNLPPTHPLNIRACEAAARIREATDPFDVAPIEGLGGLGQPCEPFHP